MSTLEKIIFALLLALPGTSLAQNWKPVGKAMRTACVVRAFVPYTSNEAKRETIKVFRVDSNVDNFNKVQKEFPYELNFNRVVGGRSIYVNLRLQEESHRDYDNSGKRVTRLFITVNDGDAKDDQSATLLWTNAASDSSEGFNTYINVNGTRLGFECSWTYSELFSQN